MIKNRLGKALIAVVMFSSALMADTVIYPDYSLIGIEGGVTRMNYDISNVSATQNERVNNIGVKIGAESYNYRIFLMANYYTNPDDSYDYIGSYGGELDYLLNVASWMNLYIGVNGGMVNMKFTAPSETTKRLVSNMYYGADAGLNLHVTKLIDLELGARFMMIDATNTKNSVTYTVNNFITGYGSIIFKFEMP